MIGNRYSKSELLAKNMAIPLLSAAPASINARVNSFMITGEETPRRGSQDPRALDILIEQAYRQIFFHAFKADRDPLLESRLRSGQITVREFVRGLLLSNKFRDDFYRCNSNYRIVEHLIGRVLGRPTYGVQEQIAWSIVIAERGLPELVDTLLNSEEYLLNFGEDQVPFQRSRLLAGRAIGDLPFNQQAPRYGDYWREITAQRAPGAGPAGGGHFNHLTSSPAWVAGQPPLLAQRLWLALLALGSLEIGRLLISTIAAMLSTNS
jgi:phycobilisome rod-core linker protein